MKSVVHELSQVALFKKVGDICATVNKVTDEKELLEVSLVKIMDLYSATRGSIFILNEDGSELNLKVAQGMKSKEEKDLVKRMGEGIVGRVAQLKQPLFVDDISDDARFSNFKERSSYTTPSFICAPLMIKDKLIGVINITDKQSGNRFNAEDMQLLDFLTSQVALNYLRIKLYTKFKKVIKEKQTLKDKLGQTHEEKDELKKQVVIHEKLATIGKLAGGIAHEFNNPLDGVMRYTNLSLDHLQDDDDVVRGYLLEIKHGLNRMANIVRNLLACSRNDINTQETVELQKALEHAIAGKQNELKTKNISVKKSFEDDIPVIQDLGLERVFVNLLNNAIDAIKQDGKIHVSVTNHSNQLVIRFSDTGEGIRQEDLEQVFEPFFTTKDIDKGCGLGLTIVSEIIKSYEGAIDVESKKDQGTTFIITLPI